MNLGDRVEFRRQMWQPEHAGYLVEIGVGTLIQHGRFRAVRLDCGKICVVDSRDIVVPCGVPATADPVCVYCGWGITRRDREARTWAGVYHRWCLDWMCRVLKDSTPKE